MDSKDIKKLRRLTNFEALVDYFRDELAWPIEGDDADANAWRGQCNGTGLAIVRPHQHQET